MSKKNKEDIWVICPECKIKVKQENLRHHMKHVHNKIIDEAEIKPLETLNKTKNNKSSKFTSEKTLSKLAAIFIVLIVLISLYFLFYSNNFNNQNNNGSYFVSIDGKGDYSSIQEAIDSASDNETIFVSAGTYFENIKLTKPLELIGKDKNTTIIRGNGSDVVIYISADYVKIRGFKITNGGPAGTSDAGIEIGSSYNTISDCDISSNQNYGLYLQASPKNTKNKIKNNIFSNNKRGIFAYTAKANNISLNMFKDNTDYGMYLQGGSDNNTISDNIFTENSNYALRILGSDKNTVINNRFISNNKGLYFCCGATNNIAYSNVFINNTNWNARDDIRNTWDNGSVGNYWDDYNGTDADGDGIGDSVYTVSSGNVDNYPLMQPI